MIESCFVCGSQKFEEIFNGLLIKCTSCGFVTAETDTKKDLVSEIYTDSYFKGEEYFDYPADKNVHHKNFNKRIDFILKKVDRLNIRSVLEIGCAYGFFGKVLLKRLPGIVYTGLDVAAEAVNYGKSVLNLDLYQGDYLNFKPAGKYTDVFMWDVIEHLQRPDKFLEKIYNELDNQGRLYITTGDIGRLLPRIQGSKWRLIHPPSHLHYFSVDTMKLLLKNMGFAVVSVSYPPIYRSIRQIFYSLFLLNKKTRKLKEKFYNILPVNTFIPINTFDIMRVIAVKYDRKQI